jgi:putative ABC transport system permease protein
MQALRDRFLTPIRALVPVFFGRLFESELAAGGRDQRASVYFLIAFLAMPGFLAPVFSASAGVPWKPAETWGWDLIARRLGTDVLRLHALSDKGLYLAASMTATGLLAALIWNSLLTDRKDAMVLGPLPVSARTVVLARLIAVGAFFVGVSVAMHLLSSVSFGLGLSVRNTFGFTIDSIVAHFVASFAASLFVLLSVTGVQGLALSVLGPRTFVRVSPLLQVGLVGVILTLLALLPSFMDVLRATSRDGGFSSLSAAATWLPPLWYLGLYETWLGGADEATRALGHTGVLALGIATGVTLVGYAVSGRRVMRSALDLSGRPTRGPWLGAMIIHALTRDSSVRALAQFTVCSLLRLERQRFILASALGAGVAWGLPGWLALGRGDAVDPTASVIAISYSVLVFVLGGARIAMAVPADLNAAWVFEHTTAPAPAARHAAERLMLSLGVVTIALVSAVAAWALWGWSVGLTHFGMTLAVGGLLTQTLLWRFPGIPCALPWSAGAARIRTRWPLYLLGFAACTSGMAAIETAAATRPHVAILAITYIAAVAWGVRHVSLQRAERDRRRREETVDFTGTDVRSTGDAELSPPVAHGRRSAPGLFGNYTRRGRLAAAGDAIRELVAACAQPATLAHELRADVRVALRRLIYRPGYATFAVLTIAIGVGATTTVYAITYGVLLKPVDIPDIDRVMNLYQQDAGSLQSRLLSLPDYQDFRARQSSFETFTAYSYAAEILRDAGHPQVIVGEGVDGSYFSFVGATMSRGRPIQPADDSPSAADVIVVSDRLWRTVFASDPLIVGKAIRLGGNLFEVIGIAGPDVRGLVTPNIRPSAFWVPLSQAARDFRSVRGTDARDRHWLFVKGRLRPGASPESAKSEFQGIGRQLDVEHPINPNDLRYRRHWAAISTAEVRVMEGFSVYVMPITIVIMGATAVVLLIACSNLANLNLARAMRRRQELAVRLALGASRMRLIREEVIEATLVALAAGAAALFVAQGITAYFRTSFSLRLESGIYAQIAPSISGPVLLVMVLATIASIVVSGIWPAWQLTRTDPRQAMAAGSPTVSPGGWRGRQMLVTAHVAGSVALLAIAMLFGGELLSRVVRNPGFDVEHVSVARLEVGGLANDGAELDQLQQRLRSRLDAVPGVTASALISALPTGSPAPLADVASQNAADDRRVQVGRIEGTPELFRAIGVPLLKGRTFLAAHDDGSREVVISRLTAERVFGNDDVVGREIYIGRGNAAAAWTIVGVAADTDVMTIGERDRGLIYGPLGSRTWSPLLVARTTEDASSLASRMSAVIAQASQDVAVIEATTADGAAGIAPGLAKFVTALASVLGASALLLSLAGLFGVLSARVADRTRDIGIHTALGASRRGIVRMVLIDGLRPVLEGLVAGGLAAVAIRASARALFPAVVPGWTWMLVAIPVLLVTAGTAACYLPARRALAIDPARTLKEG